MKTKFIYIFAIISLGMSSFAVARTYGNLQNHYVTSPPQVGTVSDKQNLCEAAKKFIEDGPKKDADCTAKGEFDKPKNIVPDSECSCHDVEPVPGSNENYQCSYGVSWQCSFDND